mgnify:CR=1 FL=1
MILFVFHWMLRVLKSWMWCELLSLVFDIDNLLSNFVDDTWEDRVIWMSKMHEFELCAINNNDDGSSNHDTYWITRALY